MEGYGLVLAGGGGKGAYQLGAWKALKEMNVRFDAIIGVSIGSINGALIAADEYDKAVDMWKNVSIDKGIKINSELPDPENLLSKKNWGTLFREFVKNGGLDASPAMDFVSQYIDEDKVRKSMIDFGVIAVQLSQPGNKYELFLEDIPKGELVNYLMASANVPFANNIGPEGEKYLDGGAYDNIPVMSLKKRGYNRLIVVDISNIKGIAHNLNILNSQITYIRPYDMEELGATFDFDSAAVERRIQLGYYDTKKAFSQLLGRIYYFLPSTFRSMVIRYGADTVMQLEELAYTLGVDLMEIYTAEGFILATKEALLRYSQELAAKAEKNSTEEKTDETDAKEWDFSIFKAKLKERQEAKENEPSFIRSTLRKRFSSKNPLEDYPEAVALLDNYII
ncbi:MAG: patatin-like phospholipase family protein [Clostridia bacterium]|nr:patatin-like phospholipase family protein [Clostridia bacterium]